MSEDNNGVSLTDVFEAIKTIKRYIDVRDRLNKFLQSLASAGIDVSRVNFSNPMSLMSVLAQAKQSGVNIDIDDLMDEIGDDGNISLEDVNRAVKILRDYAYVSRRVDSVLKVFQRSGKTGIDDLSNLASLFGLKLPNVQSETQNIEEIDTEEEDELSEEDKEELSEIVRKFKRGEL